MNLEEVLHMVGGAGQTSYATNSRIQENAISKAKFLVQETMVDLYCALLSDSLAIADLGCSSGPNTFMVISEIMEVIGSTSRQLGRPPPELQFFLNDLPGNDFNTIFRTIHAFESRVKGETCVPFYVVGVPGSFYGKLFPNKSIHFMHSSISVNWLSKVPQGLISDMGAPLHKTDIYIAKATPSNVIKSYSEQYRRDFSTFLNLRSEEIISGGRIVLTLLGRKGSNPSSAGLCYFWGLLAEALNAMVSEGLLKETSVDDFNLPFYAPSMDEVKVAIQSEGSFEIVRAHTFELNWDPFDDSNEDYVFDNIISGGNIAKYTRAIIEPMLASQFGEALMDDLFSRYAKNVAGHLLREKTKHVIFTISLKARG